MKLPYGRTGVETTLPDAYTTVVEPVFVSGVDDPAAMLREALREPVHGKVLRELVHAGQSVVIAVCDGAAPTPQLLMVEAILAELSDVIDPVDVTVVIAGGGRGAEDLLQRFSGPGSPRVTHHDPDDVDRLVWLGEHGRAVPVWLNRDWFEADVRITAAVVEPHAFAGFSGGPRLVAAGLVGTETAMSLHSRDRVNHPRATWGNTEGNPVYDDVRAVAAAVGNVDFALDVLLNRDRDIVAAFGGSLFHMHAEACHAARELALCVVRGRYEVVVTTNLGYPTDRTLYECIPALAAAATVVKPGGAIVLVAECRDGFAHHGDFRQTLSAEVESAGMAMLDQWDVHVLTTVQSAGRIILYTSHMGPAELSPARLEHTRDIEATVAALVAEAGPGVRVCVLPEGPQTIPYVVG